MDRNCTLVSVGIMQASNRHKFDSGDEDSTLRHCAGLSGLGAQSYKHKRLTRGNPLPHSPRHVVRTALGRLIKPLSCRGVFAGTRQHSHRDSKTAVFVRWDCALCGMFVCSFGNPVCESLASVLTAIEDGVLVTR